MVSQKLVISVVNTKLKVSFFTVRKQIKRLICFQTSEISSVIWILCFKRRKRNIFSHNCGFVVNIYRLEDGDFSSSDLTEAEDSPEGQTLVVRTNNFPFSVKSELETALFKTFKLTLVFDFNFWCLNLR